MSKYDNLDFHPTMEKVVDILRKKTQNQDPVFFRLVVSYFFSKIASMMRTNVMIGDEMIIPVNMYAVNLAPSGSGKGHSIAIIEDEIINSFRQRFLDDTFVQMAKKRLTVIANQRAIRDQSCPDTELERVQAEFEELGVLLFSFDSGTSAAIKQMRTKLLMAGAGSMNLEIDEIGSNMTGNTEVLNNYLELFDTGKIKQKLTKNTRDNVRSEDLFGPTPTNMLLFGTPTKLLNGSRIEDEFYEMLEIGYARRCFFGFSRYRKASKGQTAQDMYNLYHDPTISLYLTQLSDRLGMLADGASFGQTIRMKHDVLLQLYDYRIHCQKSADKLSEFEDVRKAEISHRYFKVAKLAAVYAYIDKVIWISPDHLKNAIAMAEQSGVALDGILNRDRPHVKLAKYITGIGKEMTQADLTDDLPFYKGTEQDKREMMNLAIGYGYKNGMYIKIELLDDIQFISGKKVDPTDLDKLKVSYSKNITAGYYNDVIRWDQYHALVENQGYHWVNHHLKNGYRDNEHVIPGADVIVLDVEHSIDVDTARLLLKDYTFLIHTTKRHTDKAHRYRIIIPLDHQVELNPKEYAGFMKNIYEWLPFDVDTATHDRCRKWLANKGKHWYNKGLLLDTLQFIPKTKKAEDRKQILAGQTNLNALERWSINQAGEGNRNHTLARYAFTLVELGHDFETIRSKVMDMNSKLEDPLDEAEIHSTILQSVNKRITTKGE